jgi:glycosyltransferase involved in cell wall biosynthesis
LDVDLSITGWLKYSELVNYLNSCHIAVNPIIKKSFASVINKHADYSLAALPVINTQSSSEYKKLLIKYNAGLSCKSGDFAKLSGLIYKVITSDDLYKKLRIGSKKMGVELFDRSISYPKLLSSIISNLKIN